MTRHRTFSTVVKGDWKPGTNLDFCEGKWLWEEAKNKLLLEFDNWRTRVFSSDIKCCKIHSMQWRYKTGIDIVAGAKLYLDVIFE